MSMTNYMMAFMPMVSFHSSGFLTYGHRFIVVLYHSPNVQSTNKRSQDEELHLHRVQLRMISVDNFFVFFRLLFFALLLLYVT